MTPQPTSLSPLQRLAVLIGACASFALFSGCMLPPLEETDAHAQSSADANTAEFDATSSADAASGADTASEADATLVDAGADTSNPTTPSEEPSDDFQAVAQVLRANCSTCHGPNPLEPDDNHFSMPGGATSTDMEVFEALYEVEASTGKPLVAPGVPDESVLFDRLNSDSTDSDVMPPGGWTAQHFDDAESAAEAQDHARKFINQVRIWIANGAEFESPS